MTINRNNQLFSVNGQFYVVKAVNFLTNGISKTKKSPDFMSGGTILFNRQAIKVFLGFQIVGYNLQSIV